MGKKLTQQNFIDASNKKHNNKFNYSLVKLINSTTKVEIICPIHGLFNQTPEIHLKGSECPKCSYEKRGNNCKKNIQTFIDKAILIHSDKYNYTKLNYVTTHTNIEIICKIHGGFYQKPSHHLNGNGCPKCGNDVKSKEYFLLKAKEVHGEFYDYSNINFLNTKIKVDIICPIHGVFKQTPQHHYNGSGCPICRESKGERKIRNFLQDNNINFISQHRFSDCRDKRSLPFDFYLPDLNICVEFDGEQHFKSKERWGGEAGLLDRGKKDKIKTEYCNKKNIKLIRIKNNEKLNIMR